MKKLEIKDTFLFCFFIFLFTSKSQQMIAQVKQMGLASDSVFFNKIILGNDSSIYFVGNKGYHDLYVVKTNLQLDTIWTITFPSPLNSHNYFTSSEILLSTNELLVNFNDNRVIKLASNGSVVSDKLISIPGTSQLILSNIQQNGDSLNYSFYFTDSIRTWSGIAVGDTDCNISTVHFNGDYYCGENRNFGSGYFNSCRNELIDSTFNVISQTNFSVVNNYYYIGFSAGPFVLNDSTIIGSLNVSNSFVQEAGEIYKMTREGLQWVVKDDVSVGYPAFNITPIKAYWNGDIAILLEAYYGAYISIIDSTGYPKSSNQLNINRASPFSYNPMAGISVGDKIVFAFDNIIGLADSLGATCNSTQDQMVQYSSLLTSSTYLVTNDADTLQSFSWNDSLINSIALRSSNSSTDICTSLFVLNEQGEPNERLYPNPWKEGFRIKGLAKGKSEIAFTDLAGKLQYQTSSQNEDWIAVPDELPLGVYLVKVLGSAKVYFTIKN